jgi:hypothetical protein
VLGVYPSLASPRCARTAADSYRYTLPPQRKAPPDKRQAVRGNGAGGQKVRDEQLVLPAPRAALHPVGLPFAARPYRNRPTVLFTSGPDVDARPVRVPKGDRQPRAPQSSATFAAWCLRSIFATWWPCRSRRSPRLSGCDFSGTHSTPSASKSRSWAKRSQTPETRDGALRESLQHGELRAGAGLPHERYDLPWCHAVGLVGDRAERLRLAQLEVSLHDRADGRLVVLGAGVMGCGSNPERWTKSRESDG